MGVFLVGVVLRSTYVMHWCINSNNEMKESALPKSISSGSGGGGSKKKVNAQWSNGCIFLKFRFSEKATNLKKSPTCFEITE